MAVCISGMHRSGTSMVANLLRQCGLCLGDAAELIPADPRSSLPLPFCTSLLPDLKVIVCLRNPLEVGWSLRQRPVFKHAAGNVLWNHLKEIRAKLSLTRRRYFSMEAC